MEEYKNMFESYLAPVDVDELGQRICNLFGCDSIGALTASDFYYLLEVMHKTPVNKDGKILIAKPLTAFLRCDGRPNRLPADLIKLLIPGAYRGMGGAELQKVCPLAGLFADGEEYLRFASVLAEFAFIQFKPFDVVTFAGEVDRPSLVLGVDGTYVKVRRDGTRVTKKIKDVDTVSSYVRHIAEAAYVTEGNGGIIYKVTDEPEALNSVIRLQLTAIKVPRDAMYLLGAHRAADIEWAKPGEWKPMTEEEVRRAIYGND